MNEDKLKNACLTLPNNKILDHSKIEAFADKKVNLPQKSKTCLGSVQGIAETEKMLVTTIVYFILKLTSKNCFYTVFKSSDCVVKV